MSINMIIKISKPKRLKKYFRIELYIKLKHLIFRNFKLVMMILHHLIGYIHMHL